MSDSHANTRLSGCYLASTGWMRGQIETDDRGYIIACHGHPILESDIDGSILLPGFIDLHVHGAQGAEVTESADSVQAVAKALARWGTTSFLATTLTASAETLLKIAGFCQTAMKNPQEQAAHILGIHLEGPYINPEKLGAQDPFARALDLAEIQALHTLAPIRVVTLSPETLEDLSQIQALKALGIRVQMGHSLASYEEGVAALEAGASGFTHLFNAMTGLHHRRPGLVGAALAHADFAEIIVDLIHIHPGAIKAALRAIPHLYCVSDAMAATGMPDGDYHLGQQCVHKCQGAVRLGDGTLAGSVLTMDQAFRNLISLGLNLEEASYRTATAAARYLGLSDRGQLAVGQLADVVQLNPSQQVEQVWLAGKALF